MKIAEIHFPAIGIQGQQVNGVNGQKADGGEGRREGRRERGNRALRNETPISKISGLLTLRCSCYYQDKLYPHGGRRKDMDLYWAFCLTHDKYQTITNF